MNQSDRRRHPRASMVTRVTHFTAGVDQFYYSCDISLGGMFLETRKPYPVGAEVELSFSLPGRGRRLELKARVARSVSFDLDHPERTPGMGLEFERPPREAVNEISQYLQELREP